MSLQYSEYNLSDDNSDKKTTNKRGATRKRRCKIGTNKIQNLLKSVEIQILLCNHTIIKHLTMKQ